MKTFIVAIPLFDSAMRVQAYKLCDRTGEKLFGMMDDYRQMSEVMLSPGLDLVEFLGIEPFAGDKQLFVDINKFQLLMGVPTNLNLPPEQLVCVLPGDLPLDDAVLLQRLQRLQELGYGLAYGDVPEQLAGNPYLALVRYIMINYSSVHFAAKFQRLRPCLGNFTIVFGEVPDQETYLKLQQIKPALFSGGFYSRPITSGISEISPLKVNALQLLNQVNAADFDLTDIAKIIGRDPSLSISLLRFINSGLSGGAKRIESIRNAVAILGQKEVKRWATVAISVQLAEDRPNEITKLSLVRAKFAENLATVYELGVFAPQLFLAGLFSLLDVILQKPMVEAMREVAVDERVRQALVDKSGELYEVLDLIYHYEHADWDGASINIIRNHLKVEDINKAFTGALVWYKQLLEAIDEERVDDEVGGGKVPPNQPDDHER